MVMVMVIMFEEIFKHYKFKIIIFFRENEAIASWNDYREIRIKNCWNNLAKHFNKIVYVDWNTIIYVFITYI